MSLKVLGFKVQASPASTVCCLWIKMYSSQLLLQCHACLLPAMGLMNLTSETTRKPPINWFLRVVLIIMYLHNNITVI